MLQILEHVVKEQLTCTFKIREKDCYFCCLLCNFIKNATLPRVFFMHFKKATFNNKNGTFPLDTRGWDNVDIMLFQLQRRLLETVFNPTSFLKARKKFIFIFLYSILLHMKKLSNTVNHSNKLMLTYFFRAVFINLYFKTKHSNETFHLGFYSLSNVFSYRKRISSKSNISVLTIFRKSRNMKIIAPYSHFMV